MSRTLRVARSPRIPLLALLAVLTALPAIFLVGDGAPPAHASHTLATPTGVTATPGDGQVTVSWSAVAQANSYQIQYREQLSGSPTRIAASGTSFNFTALNHSITNGRFYEFRVRAVGSGHTASAYSSWVTALPRATAPTTQVSNHGQLGSSTLGITTVSAAQGFTTGSNSAGYTLSSIEVDGVTALNAAAAAKVRAELWSDDGGTPGERLETLTIPSTLSAGVNAFTAPLGTVLAPETTYHVVFYTNSGQTLRLGFTDRVADDTGAAPGFSIADDSSSLSAADPHNAGSATWALSGNSESYRLAVKGAARAEGSGKPVWSATLNVANLVGTLFGCSTGLVSCESSSALSNWTFVYEGNSESIWSLYHTNHSTDASRILNLSTTLIDDAAFKQMTLHVGGRTFAVANAAVEHDSTAQPPYSTAVWTGGTGMTWAATDTIRVILTIPEASSNNNLRTLTASTATSETGTYTTQTLTPAFTAGTQRYAVTVGNAVTHARLTPTVDDTGKATVQVGKRGTTLTTVGDGTASNPIALDVGDNAIIVRVTAENEATQDYRVTIRRQSANANLGQLRVSIATSETGQYYLKEPLTPPFAAGTTTYSLRVDPGNTHAKVTPTSENSEATVQVGQTVATLATVVSGRASAPIALSLGANKIIVRVTAEDTSITRDYTLTVNRDGTPTAPADLTVAPGSHALDLTWTAPGVTVDGYDVHYTTMAVTDLADDAESGGNRNPHLGWVDIGKRDRAAKAGIGGLNPGQVYRVRVRAYNSHGIGPWAVAPPPAWEATLQVADLADGNTGCANNEANVTCTSNFTSRVFAYKGVTYRLRSAKSFGNGDFQLNFYSGPDMTALEPLTLRVGATELSMADAGLSTSNQLATWNNRPGILPSGQRVNFYLFDPAASAANIPTEAPLTVSLTATPERVREGDPVTITATVMQDGRPVAVQEDLEILLSTHLGTAEAGDVGAVERIRIGKHSSSGSATIQTNRDGDNADETFAVLIRWIPKQDLARVGDPRIVWVTITEGDAAPPEPQIVVPQLRASGGDGTLHLSWRDAATGHNGYDVQYKLSSAADRPATTAGDPATGWVDAGHTGRERSLTISGLTNWLDHDVRVRLSFSDGTGRWSEVVSAYPREPATLGEPRAVTVTISDTTAEEGETVTLTATLDEPAPREGATVQFWAYGDTIGGTATAATAWRDYRLSPPSVVTSRHSDLNRDVTSTNDFTTAPITIGPGQTTATATLAVQGGHGDEGTEGIRVYATAEVPDADREHGRRVLTSPAVTMTIYEQGQSPTVGGQQGSPPEQETAALPTAVSLSLDRTAISESAGAVTVTATLDAPAPADGNGVSLGLYPGNESTATRNSDYTMPDSLVIPAGQRSGTASIAITNDAVDEADETVSVAVFADTGYATLSASAPTLTIVDDDTAGVTVSAASPLTLDEGATATYTVVLDSQPTADVTITAASGDSGAASVSPASHTFTSSTWSTPVTFTVSGVADSDTNDETVGVSHSVTSDDANYAAALVSAVTVSVSDTTQEQLQQTNRPPTVASAIGDLSDLAAGDTRDVSVSGVFSDLDGDALTITAGSSSDGVATVVVSADQSTLTLTGVAAGTATITVTAEDADGNRVSDAFEVTVAAPQSPLSGIAARYDANGDGAIDGLEYQQVKNDMLSGKITYDEFLEVVRFHRPG